MPRLTGTQPLQASAPAQQAGSLELTLGVAGGRTRITGLHTRSPLGVMRALHLDSALPDLAVVFLTNSTAGVLAADDLRTEVRVTAGARALLTTPSATKVFSMPHGHATLTTRLQVASNALLEYLPEPLIPFEQARVDQQTVITLSPGAALFYADTMTTGRTGMGETLAFARYQQRLTLQTDEGRPLYHEAFTLEPERERPDRTGLLGACGHAVMASVLVAGPGPARTLVQALRAALAGHPCVAAGAGLLAGQTGAGVRLLAPTGQQLRPALHDLWAAFRQWAYGTGTTDLRRT